MNKQVSFGTVEADFGNDNGFIAIPIYKELKARNAQLEEALKVAMSALKSTVGYEPFVGSLEPRKSSEALAVIEKVLVGE